MPLPPSEMHFDPRDVRTVRRSFGDGAGYGFNLPPEVQQRINAFQAANPNGSIESCLQALSDVLEGAIQTSDMLPWIARPYRGTDRFLTTRVLVNTPVAVSAAANAAGLLLAAANSTYAPVTVVTPGVAGGSVNLLTINAPQTAMVRLVSWGVTVINADAEALVTGVTGGTVAGSQPTGPDPVSSSYLVPGHQPAYALVAPSKVITITGRNLSDLVPVSATPLLVYTSVSWWEFPITRFEDTAKRSRLRSGYGLGCK